jgi:DNA-binding response OmpR family regulator
MATILICDDEEPLRALVRAALDGAGHELHEASDGDEAIELCNSLRPDVVVLDMMMPGRTGLEVLTELRADADLAGTTVVMLTARAQAADRASALAAGADLFVAKPFSPLELAAAIDGLLARR